MSHNTDTYAYPKLRRVVYEGGATFVPVCLTCGRFVIPDEEIVCGVSGGIYPIEPETTAMCSRCGRTKMPFEGFIG